MNLSPKSETLFKPLSYLRKPTVVRHFGKGPMAEWLGSALQKLLQRFESASDLQPQPESPKHTLGVFLCPKNPAKLAWVGGEGYKNSKRASRRA